MVTDFQLTQTIPLRGASVSVFPANTLIRSSGYTRSRSAAELLHAQKTELPCLATVCLEKPTPCPNGLSEKTIQIDTKQRFFLPHNSKLTIYNSKLLSNKPLFAEIPS
jgi:hypothetical protein